MSRHLQMTNVKPVIFRSSWSSRGITTTGWTEGSKRQLGGTKLVPFIFLFLLVPAVHQQQYLHHHFMQQYHKPQSWLLCARSGPPLTRCVSPTFSPQVLSCTLGVGVVLAFSYLYTMEP